MLLDLADRVVLITGAGRGIGRVIAEAFLRERSVVAGLDVEIGALEWLTSSDEGRAAAFACDVRDGARIDAVVAEVLERFGRIDVLVNNAGVFVDGLVEELDDNQWNFCFDVNVGGTFRMCRAVIPAMKAQQSGRIINAASFAAIVPSVGGAAYAASKAAVVQFTRTLAGELGPWDITANAYAPGMIPTAMNRFADLTGEARDRLLDTLALRRWGEPEEVAALVCFLASDAARYITGTLVDVSGGKLATQLPRHRYESAGR
jgi:3-oxoacyl-[acyl-carrier protein] reductase